MNQPNALWRQLGRAVAGREADLRAYAADEVLEAAKFNGVCAMLAWRLDQGAPVAIEERLVAPLNGVARLQAVYDLTLTAITRRFMDLLSRRDIRVILLKGSAVSSLHYPEAYLRMRSDIDVAIADERAEEIVALLAEDGYQVVNHELEKLSTGQFQASRDEFQGDPLWFDIHRRMSNRGVFRDCFSFEDLDAGRQPVAKLGPDAWAPSDAHLLIHGAMHRVAHGRGTHATRLNWLYDLALLFEAMDSGQRQAFVREALERRMGAVCARALATCEAGFGMDFPADLGDELMSQAAQEPAAKLLDAGRVSWAWSDLMQHRSLGGKIRFAGELLSNRLRGILPNAR